MHSCTSSNAKTFCDSSNDSRESAVCENNSLDALVPNVFNRTVGLQRFLNKKCCERNSAHHSLGTFYDFELADRATHIALDCEMVGVGTCGKKSVLGRCSIVDYDGNLLCDIFAKPDEPVTDYRTRWSGLRREHGVYAVPIGCARRLIKRILKNKIVVGHSLHNDFDVLALHIPKSSVRDLAKCTPLQKMASSGSKGIVGLRRLSKILLGKNIQESEHCSIEDARATMQLYRLVENEWEIICRKKFKKQRELPASAGKEKIRTASESFLDDAFWPEDFEENVP